MKRTISLNKTCQATIKRKKEEPKEEQSGGRGEKETMQSSS